MGREGGGVGEKREKVDGRREEEKEDREGNGKGVI